MSIFSDCCIVFDKIKGHKKILLSPLSLVESLFHNHIIHKAHILPCVVLMSEKDCSNCWSTLWNLHDGEFGRN